jgi:hypothetical protein
MLRHWERARHLGRWIYGLLLLGLSLGSGCPRGPFHLLSEAGIPHACGMTIGDIEIGCNFVPVNLPCSVNINQYLV